MRKHLVALAALAVLLVAKAALAGDLATEVPALRDAVAERVTAIGTPATKPEKREAKKLGKAQTWLGKYVGVNDTADLTAVGKAGAFIAGSKTTDAAIAAEARDVVDAFLAFAESDMGPVEAALAALFKAKHTKVVQKLIDKANRQMDRARLVPDDIAKAWSRIEAARRKLRAALKKAERYARAGWPAGLDVSSSPYAFVLVNSTTRRYWMADVIITGNVYDTSGSVISTPSGLSARETWPELFVTTHFPGGGFDANHLIEKRFGSDPPIWHDMLQYLSGLREALGVHTVLTFTGNVSIRVSKRDSAKADYQITFPLTGRQF